MNLLKQHINFAQTFSTTNISIEKDFHFIRDQATMITRDMKNILKNVNIFEDSDILRVIKMTEEIHDFDKHFNFNIDNFTTNTHQADENILKKNFITTKISSDVSTK